MNRSDFQPLKNILLTAACWLLQWVCGYFSAMLMYTGMFSTFEAARVGKLTYEVVKVHPVCFAAGAVLSPLLFALIWFLLLSRTFPFWRTEKRKPLLIWRLQAVIGLAGLFCTQIFAMVQMKDRAVSLRSSLPLPRTIRPAFAENYPVIMIAAAVILLLSGCQAIRQTTPAQIAQSHTDL